jgi:hypothetical protein
MEVTMNVRVRPHNHPKYFSEFSHKIQKSPSVRFFGAEADYYKVTDGKIDLLIAAGAFCEFLEQQEDEFVHSGEILLVPRGGPVHMRMIVSIRIRPTPSQPIGDTREWDTQFFQGGLPSLGKRKP